MDSSVGKSVIRSVLSKSLSRDIETLVRKWGCFSESDIQKLNFRATKSAIASQIFELCKELGLKQEIGDLDLLCTQLHSSSKKWTVLKLKGDDIYGKLERSFLPKTKGKPPHPPQLVLTNHSLLQLQLLKDEGNKTFKDVAVWFHKLFPTVSFPADRLGRVLNRLTKEVKRRHSAGADLLSFLQNVVDFDFVSVALSELGVKWGQLMEEEAIPEDKAKLHESLSHEVVVDLENFKTKERLRDSFTVKWIRKLTGTTEVDKDLSKGIKAMMNRHRTISRNKGNKHNDMNSMQSLFLAMPFSVQENTQSCSTTSQSHTPPDTSTAKLAKASKEIQQLKEKDSVLETEIAVLKAANKDLSRDKMRLLAETAGKQKLVKNIETLETTVTVQRQRLAELKPERLQIQYLKNTNTYLERTGGQLKTDLDPQDLRDRLAAVLETDCLGDVHLNVKSYGGAIWIRVYVQGAAPFKTTDVVYVLSYPHTPILIACRMKVKMQEIVYSALVEVFESEEVTELQLTGHHLPSLADLALQQTSQGPFRKYRNIEEAVNPLIRSKVSTKSVTSEDKERETDERLMDENREEKQSRQERLDSTFGTHAQPTLEKLEYKLDLRFRGTTFAPGMKGQPDLFHCRVKFEGPSVLEGTKNLGRTGFASLPLPRHLAKVHSLAKNHFTVAEMDSTRKRPSSQTK